MLVSFVADEGAFEADGSALICGVSGGDRWLTFQRDALPSPDDWGIHLEYSGQANGGYGCVAACRLDPQSLRVDLGRQLGQLVGIDGFDVALRLKPEALRAVCEGLRQVFRGQAELLSIGEQAAQGTP